MDGQGGGWKETDGGEDYYTRTCRCTSHFQALPRARHFPLNMWSHRKSKRLSILLRGKRFLASPFGFLVEIIHTPAGETVLDLGQNLTGIFRLKIDVPYGGEVKLSFGEVLQNGNFYRDNLRSAKAEYIYKSAGKPVVLSPKFTFYGYRYVKVEGLPGIKMEDFTALVLYSDIPKEMEMPAPAVILLIHAPYKFHPAAHTLILIFQYRRIAGKLITHPRNHTSRIPPCRRGSKGGRIAGD